MLEIDGSYGEGGGQILRNSIALSALLKKPVKVCNIRSNRPNPGIKAQHYISISSIGKICNAEIKNLEIGSDSVEFIPGDIVGGNYSFDIGTAGSITLAFQAIILACCTCSETVKVTLTGGTDVKWSPSWDYYKNVFIRYLGRFGYHVDCKLIRRGYYPKGGGKAEIMIHPANKLKAVFSEDEVDYSNVEGMVNIGSLNENISTRIKHSVMKALLKNNVFSDIDVDKADSLSPGVGVAIWSKSNDYIIGADVLGERGVSSEDVGKSVVDKLLAEIRHNCTMDVNSFDQLLPYMVLTRKQGKSNCFIRKISNHAGTNMWLLNQFFDVDFEALQLEENIRFTIV